MQLSTGRVSSLGKSSHSQQALPSSKHPLRIPFPLPPSLKGGQRRKRTVWCRSDTLIVPFPNLLRPPPEAEVVVGGAFQGLWAALPYGQVCVNKTAMCVCVHISRWRTALRVLSSTLGPMSEPHSQPNNLNSK